MMNDKETWLIVGLGNPGATYAHTRHNAGFDSVDVLVNKWNLPLTKKRMDGMLAEKSFPGGRVVVCQPQTYMNLSGECVRQLLQWYKCPSNHLIVIYDDIDLPLGKLRVRKSGSAGTHNGMRSIIQCIGTQDFPRIRVGVGAKPEGWDLADWVLSKYQTREEQDAMNEAFKAAAECAECWLDKGIEHAMQTYNKK